VQQILEKILLCHNGNQDWRSLYGTIADEVVNNPHQVDGTPPASKTI
jgi:hypothetical protein